MSCPPCDADMKEIFNREALDVYIESINDYSPLWEMAEEEGDGQKKGDEESPGEIVEPNTLLKPKPVCHELWNQTLMDLGLLLDQDPFQPLPAPPSPTPPQPRPPTAALTIDWPPLSPSLPAPPAPPALPAREMDSLLSAWPVNLQPSPPPSPPSPPPTPPSPTPPPSPPPSPRSVDDMGPQREPPACPATIPAVPSVVMIISVKEGVVVPVPTLVAQGVSRLVTIPNCVAPPLLQAGLRSGRERLSSWSSDVVMPMTPESLASPESMAWDFLDSESSASCASPSCTPYTRKASAAGTAVPSPIKDSAPSPIRYSAPSPIKNSAPSSIKYAAPLPLPKASSGSKRRCRGGAGVKLPREGTCPVCGKTDLKRLDKHYDTHREEKKVKQLKQQCISGF
ncbi:vegetative cell wall protein gp1-like [Thrips palmi]|uniref:Vegetative cell wall protein gp1-like n=1 Tax=Thrips palmi TaxID=161013 RepID=A0A6P8YH36_THRPL|nr:vegetative cell wall protein gp1-like [Thrips palmi]